MSEKITVGQIWLVEKDMLANPHTFSSKVERQVLIKKGERIEIRFPYEWHFRTEDNVYFQVNEDVLREHCKKIGVILAPVFYNNKANLEEILRLNLYTSI